MKTIDDIRSDVMDASKLAADLSGDLSSAESCETDSDFIANLANAEDNAKELLKLIKSMRASAAKAVKGDDDGEDA